MVKNRRNCVGLPSNFPFGVTTLKALLDSPAAPPDRGTPVSLSSLRSPALDEATLAGRTRPVAGELEGGGSCRDLTVILKSRGIGAGTDTSIASTLVQTVNKKSLTSLLGVSHYLQLAPCLYYTNKYFFIISLIVVSLRDEASTITITRLTGTSS
jgi:hypothetical protein